jgi:hypothetical protein
MKSPEHLHRYAKLIESMLPSQFDLAFDVSRSVHRPLLMYSRLLAGQTTDVRDPIHQLDDDVWSALIFHVAGELLKESSWIERSSKKFLDLISHQQPNGAFFAPDVHANPETRWYEELITLHAFASYAVRVRDESIDSAVERAAEFHLNETQPDHATAEPWGLLAFIEYAPPLADQLLHTMSMQYPQGITGVPLLLMADVLYGLRRLTADGR